MTFSLEVKQELAKQLPKARHCGIAELSAILFFFGSVRTEEGKKRLVISCEQEMIARKCFTLIEKTFNISVGVQKSDRYFHLEVADKELSEEVLLALKMAEISNAECSEAGHVNSVLLKSTCCKRAFLRGCFLCCGSISDPAKGYHLEFVCQKESLANQIAGYLNDFEIAGKIVQRKKYYVVYLKEGSAIAELLNVLGAHVAMMNLENTRILHEIAGETNRRVNCETANLLKSVNAANAQVEAIEHIAKTVGLEALPVSLQEIAYVRLEHEDASLKELGEFLSPPVGKSGVNHRLRKIQEYADKLKG
ncbi:MAG: DNA-binding protein WhiA [Lachnospiraceae bacterium]|nr:DNA-binding protein WhiA [Lachnospiraceae bacterium]